MKVGLLLALALASIALIVACDNGGDGATPGPDGAPTPAVTDSGDETPTPAQTPSPGETPAPPNVCQPNPDPATPEFQVIDEPSEGDTVTSPVTISGQVLAFEGAYQIGIFNAAGDPIVETFGTAGPGEVGELAPFSIDVPFDVDQPKPACIWVYEASAMDGSSINVGQIPVTLSP
jgi:hypothetical protein